MFGAIFEDWSIQSIAATNAIAAWAAAMVHTWAAINVMGWLRKMFVTIACLAFFYSLAYWWLFLNPDRGADWSDFLRPFGIITWAVAWGIEPVVLVRYLTRRGQQIEQLGKARLAQSVEQSGVDPDDF